MKKRVANADIRFVGTFGFGNKAADIVLQPDFFLVVEFHQCRNGGRGFGYRCQVVNGFIGNCRTRSVFEMAETPVVNYRTVFHYHHVTTRISTLADAFDGDAFDIAEPGRWNSYFFGKRVGETDFLCVDTGAYSETACRNGQLSGKTDSAENSLCRTHLGKIGVVVRHRERFRVSSGCF